MFRWPWSRRPERELPENWLALARQTVPMVDTLTTEERARLADRMRVFLRDKQIMGVQGQVITPLVRVTIAAQACMLLLGHGGSVYPGLSTIVVYPEAYVVDGVRHNDDGTITVGSQTRRGESWTRGHVVLSWDDALQGARDPDDGLNVILHEFVHQLDALDGSANGAPLLHAPAHYAPWARVLGTAFEALSQRVATRQASLLRAYGATNPAEFLAVATEVFFERPRALRAHHPELYAELKRWLHQDPAARPPPRG